MGKFKLLSMTFALMLVHVASSPTLQQTSRPKDCLREAKYYCTDANLRDKCQVDGECEPYAVSGPCADPDVYCLKQDTALACNRTDFCATWKPFEVIMIVEDETADYNIFGFLTPALVATGDTIKAFFLAPYIMVKSIA